MAGLEASLSKDSGGPEVLPVSRPIALGGWAAVGLLLVHRFVLLAVAGACPDCVDHFLFLLAWKGMPWVAGAIVLLTAVWAGKAHDDQGVRYGSVPMVLALGLSGSLLYHVFNMAHWDSGSVMGAGVLLMMAGTLVLSGLLLLLFRRRLETEQIVACMILVVLAYLIGWAFWSYMDIALMVLLDDHS